MLAGAQGRDLWFLDTFEATPPSALRGQAESKQTALGAPYAISELSLIAPTLNYAAVRGPNWGLEQSNLVQSGTVLDHSMCVEPVCRSICRQSVEVVSHQNSGWNCQFAG